MVSSATAVLSVLVWSRYMNLHIILSCNFSPWSRYSGGGQRSTHQLATALAERGHRVTVIFTKGPWERCEPEVRPIYRLRWATIPALRSGSGSPLRPLTAVTVARAVADELRPGQRTVVHANGEEGALLPRLRRQQPFGLVVTSRYPSLPDALLGAPPGHKHLALMVTEPKYLMLAHALRGADVCAPPSQWAARLLKETFHLPEDRFEAVHNGVPEEFLKYRWDPDPNPRPIVFFGRYDVTKGVDTLLDAYHRLGKDAPPLWTFGRGPALASMRAKIEHLGLKSQVTLHDWATHDRLGLILSRASMAVLPSREENFSLAVLASLAVGVPLVATQVGGTAEMVEHGHNGLLVDAGDPRELANAIAEVLVNPGQARERAKRGRAMARDLTWARAAERFEKIYARIAA